jgi:hypothetical protein
MVPSDILIQTAAFAGRAPSIHNSQPWLWRTGAGMLDLVLVRGRLLRTTDPEARLAVLSCGAALHHARIHLAAQGWGAVVDRLPDRRSPARLARICLNGRIPVDLDAVRMARAAIHRRTDRSSAPSAPLDFDKLRSITAAARAEGNDLRLLRARQVFELAEAVDRARRAEAENPDQQRELAGWLGAECPAGLGIPDTALPLDRSYGAAPKRSFHPQGSTLVTESHQHASVFGILYGAGDEPVDWLVAGESLSAGWLTATQLDVSVLPLSLVVEVAGSRVMIGRLLGGGSPYLALRFAVASHDDDPSTRTPRLPTEAIIEQ